MDSGRNERDDLLRDQIRVMSPENFEQLVFELALREDSAVVRLQRPDGGADTIRPKSESVAARAWQAKHHKDKIDWRDCEKSLRAAIQTWNPREFTFVYPRDLTKVPQKSFETKLAQHTSAQAAGVVVNYWGLSELVRQLNQDDVLRVRFFGQSQELQLDQLHRTIAAGGKLESASDLIDRARTLSGWADQQDKDFQHRIGTGPITAPQPQWDELPYMEMRIADTTTRLEVTTWVREGASVPVPVMGFTDDEIGETARRNAIKDLAKGRPATITAGATVNITAPKFVEDLVGPIQDLPGGEMILPPGIAIPLEIELETDEETFTTEVDLRPVPPPHGRAAALAGYIGASLVVASLQLKGTDRVTLELSMSGQFADDVRANRDGAAALLALRRHRTATLRSEKLFPSAEVSGSMTPSHLPDDRELEKLELLHAVFDAAVALSEHGHPVQLPQAITPEDADTLVTARDVLRSRKGTATLHPIDRMVEAHELAGIAESLSGTTFERRVTYPLLGGELDLGRAHYVVPPLRIVEHRRPSRSIGASQECHPPSCRCRERD